MSRYLLKVQQDHRVSPGQREPRDQLARKDLGDRRGLEAHGVSRDLVVRTETWDLLAHLGQLALMGS